MSFHIGASRIVSRALVRQGIGSSSSAARSGAGPSISTSRTTALRRPLTTAKPQQPPPPPPSATTVNSIKNAKTRAGTGNMEGLDGTKAEGVAMSMIPRGPVSWASLGLVAVAAASAVAYYQIERERRLENAMGKIVSGAFVVGLASFSGGKQCSKSYLSSHKYMRISLSCPEPMQVSSESGWSPDPEFFAKRQYKKTEWGWFPVEDAFGGGECPGGRCLPQRNAKLLNGQNCTQRGMNRICEFLSSL